MVTVCKKTKLAKLKMKAKENGVTINDLLTADILIGIKRLMEKYDEKQGINNELIKAGFPMIMKENANGLRAIDLNPKLTILYMNLPLPRETSKVTTSFLHSVKNVLSNLKNSFEPLNEYYLCTYLLPLVPFYLVQHVVCFFADKMSFVFSNVAGCPEKLHIAGRKVKSMYCVAPNYSAIPFALTVTSYGEDVRTVCTSNRLDQEQLRYMSEQLHDILDS